MPDDMRTQIYEALTDTKWTVGQMTIGDARFVLITLEHLRHGPIHWIMPAATADNLAALLSRIAQEITEPSK